MDGSTPKTHRRYANIVDRILSRCVLEQGRILDTPCFIFTGYCDRDGYGRVTKRVRKPDGRNVSQGRVAHLVFWEAVTGKTLGEGMTLDHKCYRHACVREDHLDEVTRSQNSKRPHSRGHERPCSPRRKGKR